MKPELSWSDQVRILASTSADKLKLTSDVHADVAAEANSRPTFRNDGEGREILRARHSITVRQSKMLHPVGKLSCYHITVSLKLG